MGVVPMTSEPIRASRKKSHQILYLDKRHYFEAGGNGPGTLRQGRLKLKETQSATKVRQPKSGVTNVRENFDTEVI